MSEAQDKMTVPIEVMPVTMRTFETLASLPTTPERYKGKPMDMWAAALQGRELGLGPVTSVNNIILVDGQTSMYAKTMAALIFSKGHIYNLKTGPELAEITCFRYHRGMNQMFEVGHLTFSMDDAERASLLKTSSGKTKTAWKQYPQMMLANRVLSWAGRMFYADCLLGIGYSPDEFGDDVESFDVVIDEVPEEDWTDELDDEGRHPDDDA